MTSNTTLRLGVLDQSPVPEGSTGSEALHNSVDLARLAESLGYHRYWLAEHHNGPMLAGPSPEALIGAIGAVTSRMRVGSGGVMLPHYSPLKVAETFSVLSGLFPGRVDLGIGRAPGTDALTTLALQRDRRDAAPDDFPQQLAELLAYVGGELPADHPFRRLSPRPGSPSGQSRGCSAPRPRAPSGPRSSVSPTRSRTSSTPTARRSRRSTASASPPPPGWPSRAWPSGRGRWPPDRTRRPSGSRRAAGWR